MDTPNTGSVHGQVRWGSETPGPVKGVSAHGGEVETRRS